MSELKLRKNKNSLIRTLVEGLVLESRENEKKCQIAVIDVTGKNLVEEAMQLMNVELNNRVQERTQQLEWTIQELRKEIEERKRIEKGLRESEKKYRSLFEESRDAVHIIVQEGQILDVNRSWLDLSGYSREEALTMNAIDFYMNPLDRYRFQEEIEEKGFVKDYDVKLKKKDGTPMDCLLNTTVQKSDDGTILGYQGIVRDITEQKRAELKIEHSKKTLQKIFDGIAEPLMMVDKNLAVLMLNAAARNHFQVDPQADCQKPCYQLLSKESQCEGCNIVSAMAVGVASSFERKGCLDPSRIQEVTVFPLQEEEEEDDDDAVIHIRDITVEKLIQKQLTQSEKLASLGLLISGIAHEINNPNSFITFNIPILRDYLETIAPVIDSYAYDHPDYELFGMSYPEFRKDLFKLLENIEHGAHRINFTFLN